MIKLHSMAITGAFRDHIASLCLPPGPALVAVSGGPDSVALLDLLVRSRDIHGLDLAIAHVDHGIHPDSSEVADRVRALEPPMSSPCTSAGFRLVRAPVKRGPGRNGMPGSRPSGWGSGPA